MADLKTLSFIAALTVPGIVLAVGSDSTTPPTPTETTTTCTDGKIWDADKSECVDAQETRLNDDVLYLAARELAYAGEYDNAIEVLQAAANQDDSRILTYYGFANRKAGRWELAMAYYQKALAADPDNILARSYMGQALVVSGNRIAAQDQLVEIRARGGRGTWAEASLRLALQSGQTSNY